MKDESPWMNEQRTVGKFLLCEKSFKQTKVKLIGFWFNETVK